MSRKDAINSLFLGKPKREAQEASPALHPERVQTGAIGAMRASLQDLTEGARELARLQEQLKSGEHVLLLDPDLIDDSPIADRLPDEHDPGMEELRQSIAEHGQQVPILVRPAPNAEGRYQIAYGRRRLKVLRDLKKEVKAIVRPLSDEELIVAQGRENLDRAGLSFIERALFAKRLEDAGYERTVIMAALSTDKADLSRFIAVARRISESIVRNIGPAPKVGRARWLKLVELLEKDSAAARAGEVMATSAFQRANSNDRFSMLVEALSTSPRKSARARSWVAPTGKTGARIVHKGSQTSLTFDERSVPEFAAYIASRLDDLFNEYKQTKEEKEG